MIHIVNSEKSSFLSYLLCIALLRREGGRIGSVDKKIELQYTLYTKPYYTVLWSHLYTTNTVQIQWRRREGGSYHDLVLYKYPNRVSEIYKTINAIDRVSCSCVSVFQSFFMSVYYLNIFLSIFLSDCVSILLSYPFNYLTTYIYIFLLSNYVYIYPSKAIYTSFCLYLIIQLPIYLSIDLSLYLYIYLSICLYLSIFNYLFIFPDPSIYLSIYLFISIQIYLIVS